ncbi:hypothetical protein ZWY2020_044357 [Hordeum vulgare]|nr:hypothetical protein ZWY2020_044357 [Hordeum vulgare]
MEELQEADVLWPDTPPSTDHGSRLPESAAAAEFSCESFATDDDRPAASSSTSSMSSSSSSSVMPLGPGSSGGFLSDPSTFAGGHAGGGDMTEEFLEADVLWPDDGYATRERGAGGEELWWLCCDQGGAAAGYRRGRAVSAAGGTPGSWRAPLVSSPIDIPTRAAAARRCRPRALLVHRRSIGMD